MLEAFDAGFNVLGNDLRDAKQERRLPDSLRSSDDTSSVQSGRGAGRKDSTSSLFSVELAVVTDGRIP